MAARRRILPAGSQAARRWKTIDDLAPQLAEFDLRCQAQDFDTAVRVIFEFDFGLLYLWGYYQLMAELHERVQGKLSDPLINENSVGMLGHAYYQMGQYQKAIAHFGEALEHAQSREDRYGEGVWSGNLGLCYGDLAQTTRAIEYFERGLEIFVETSDRASETITLGNMGFFLADLGQIDRAADHHQRGLEISLEIHDLRSASAHMGDLGGRFAELGEVTHAFEYCNQALIETRKAEYRYTESLTLNYLGDIFADQCQWEKAIESYEQAIQIADETSNAEVAIGARSGLALACISPGDLGRASQAIVEAQRHHVPRRSQTPPAERVA